MLHLTSASIDRTLQTEEMEKMDEKASVICPSCSGKTMLCKLIAREEEREMIPFCEDQDIALTPYSPLASGRLCRPASETTKRLELDAYARFKYDKSLDVDAGIIERVREMAENKNVSMTEISLAWLFRKVTAPVMGVTKKSNIDMR